MECEEKKKKKEKSEKGGRKEAVASKMELGADVLRRKGRRSSGTGGWGGLGLDTLSAQRVGKKMITF